MWRAQNKRGKKKIENFELAIRCSVAQPRDPSFVASAGTTAFIFPSYRHNSSWETKPKLRPNSQSFPVRLSAGCHLPAPFINRGPYSQKDVTM